MGALRRAGMRVVLVGLCTLLACGCSDDASPEEAIELPSDTQSGDVADAADTADTGSDSADTRRDTGVDTTDTSDAGTGVIRRVVDVGLFGELPAENYVFNPTFSKGLRWSQSKLQSGGDRSLKAYREYYPSTPASAPVYRLPSVDQFTFGRVTGAVLLLREPMEISVWIGRPEPFAAHKIQAHVVGVEADDAGSLSQIVMREATDEALELGGRYWRRFATSVDGYYGHGHLMVQTTLGTDVYIHAPVATLASSSPGALRGWKSPEIRPATRFDRAAIRRAHRELRRGRPDPVVFDPSPPLSYFEQFYR